MITGRGELADLAIPALTVLVRLYRQDAGAGTPSYGEGRIEPRLQATVMHWRSGGRINIAEVDLVLVDPDGTRRRPEHYRQVAAAEDMVEILAPLAGADGRAEWRAIFAGFLADPEIIIDGGRESVTYTVVGVEARLNDAPVFGQHARTPVHDAECLAAVDDDEAPDTVLGENSVHTWQPLIFNPEGIPNAAGKRAQRSNAAGKTYLVRLFEAPGRRQPRATAIPWTLGEAVKYLLAAYNGDETHVFNPDFDELDEIFGTTPLNGRDLSGATQLFSEALPRLLAGTRFSFTVDPMPQDESRRCLLVFFDRLAGTGEQPLWLSPPGTPMPEALASNVAALGLRRLNSAAVRRVTAAGDYAYHQSAFRYDAAGWEDFAQGWKDAADDLADYYDAGGEFTLDETLLARYAERHQYGGDLDLAAGDFLAVGRVFTLDELGELGVGYNGATDPEDVRGPYDFGPVFDHEEWQVRRRRFTRTLEKRGGGLGGFYNPVLYAKFTAETDWQEVLPAHWQVADDRCAVVITIKDLRDIYLGMDLDDKEQEDKEINWLKALVDGTLQWSLIATVADDTRANNSHEESTEAATRFPVEHLHLDPAALRSTRIRAGADHRVGDGEVEELPGKARAGAAAYQLERLLKDGHLEARVQLLGLQFAYGVGAAVPRVIGREIDLAVNPAAAAPRYPVIAGIEIDCRKGQHRTTLELDLAR